MNLLPLTRLPLSPTGLMMCQDCSAVYPYDSAGHDEFYFCQCTGKGQLCGCKGCHDDAVELLSGFSL